MIKVVKFTFSDREKCEAAFSIRRHVFVEEQKVAPEEEYEFEEDSTHFLAYDTEQPVGTARWRKTEKGIKLERFAVLASHRNEGVGAAILKEVLNDVKELQGTKYLHAQLAAVNFYEKAGFKKVGDIFEEANILHYKMVL